MAVLAAPIDPSDVLMLTGEYGQLPSLPTVADSESVGRMGGLGPQTQGSAVGQTVLLPVGCGTWASHVVAPAASLVPPPNEADSRQLAMLTVNPPTASLLLSDFVDLKPGDWLMQTGANSVPAAVQLAKLLGPKTVNVVRRQSAIESVSVPGGDVVLVDGEDLAKSVKTASGCATMAGPSQAGRLPGTGVRLNPPASAVVSR